MPDTMPAWRASMNSLVHSLDDAHRRLSRIHALHRPDGNSLCLECGLNWPCTTVRETGIKEMP